MKTQGTDLWIIDPEDASIISVGCITDVTSVGSARATNTIPPCLSDPNGASSKTPGDLTPGTPTFAINTEPADDSHVRLHELLISGDTVKWALGWSDGPRNVDGSTASVPTVDSDGDFVLPSDRTWLTFPGFVSAFPFGFPSNSFVQTTISVEMTEPEVLVPKSA